MLSINNKSVKYTTIKPDISKRDIALLELAHLLKKKKGTISIYLCIQRCSYNGHICAVFYQLNCSAHSHTGGRQEVSLNYIELIHLSDFVTVTKIIQFLPVSANSFVNIVLCCERQEGMVHDGVCGCVELNLESS